MMTVNVREAETTLSVLLTQGEQGEDAVLARNGEPVAQVTRFQQPQRREKGAWRRLPGWEGFHYDRALSAPLSDDESNEEGWP